MGYHDSEASNQGGAYRSTTVDIEANTDQGGGYNVGWIVAGEWLNYTVDVATAGTYDLNASGVVIRDGLREKVYQRVLIKHKKK